MPDPANPGASALSALLAIGLIVVTALTLLLSLALLVLYRSRVKRGMAGPKEPTQHPKIRICHPATLPFQPVIIQAGGALESKPMPGAELYARWRQAANATVTVYAGAGFAYSAVMAVALCIQSSTLSPVSWLFFAAAFMWPVILTSILIGALPTRTQLGIVLAYVVVLILSTVVPPVQSAVFSLVLTNLGATVVTAIVRARQIRTVAPLVAAVLSVFLIAYLCILATAGVFSNSGASGSVSIGLVDHVFLFVSLFWVIIISCLLAAWLVPWWVGRRYREKKSSDQTIMMAAIWLVFSPFHSMTFAYANALWLLAGLFAFIVFLVVSTSSFNRLARRKGRDATKDPQLLVLRVFQHGRRTRRLFDVLSQRWRHVGSIQLIVGPDLAKSTVEPPEFIDFLRLHPEASPQLREFNESWGAQNHYEKAGDVREVHPASVLRFPASGKAHKDDSVPGHETLERAVCSRAPKTAKCLWGTSRLVVFSVEAAS
jgi:hypothetical protein